MKLRILAFIAIAAMSVIGPANAEIKKLSPGVFAWTICVEGYIVFLADGGAIQMLNADGKPLQCKGAKHQPVIE
jgi:hypothetical protein